MPHTGPDYTRQLLDERFPGSGQVVLSRGAPRADLPVLGQADRHPSDRIVLLTVARVHPRKGQLAVVEALGRLPVELRDRIEYRLVGPVSRRRYLRRLEELARSLGVNLAHLGALPAPDLATAYSQADVFIMTSTPTGPSVEGFGLTYLEASARGLPILAHRTGGVAEAVVHGETGLLVDPDDREALAGAISRLVTKPSLRREMGESGRRWANRFTWNATARALFAGL